MARGGTRWSCDRVHGHVTRSRYGYSSCNEPSRERQQMSLASGLISHDSARAWWRSTTAWQTRSTFCSIGRIVMSSCCWSSTSSRSCLRQMRY